MATQYPPVIRITLPSLNGDIEAGITVGVDSSLPDDKKLPIAISGNAVASLDVVKSCALIWAMDQFTDNIARTLFVNGIAGLLDLGMVCEIDNIPDGDWHKKAATAMPTEADLTRASAMVSVEEMKKGVTIAVATKANYWLMNHHTGQGAVAGYVKKVLEVFYRDRVSEQVVSAAHSLGHFASTLKVLNTAGIKQIRRATPVIQQEGANLTLSQDAKLRFASMPAGTHRCGIAYEAAKRLVRSVYARFCPSVAEFATIPTSKHAIMQQPARYHIGASYLTGLPRMDYTDTDMESYLGRLGTFINTLYKKSTIAKSPHLAEPEGSGNSFIYVYNVYVF
ncbi:uncharacterized protein LOC143898601 [Temnothorax americanus]|uniref:uncharacterized protein LOC143898601 n=1 Tax=Temnothorax americanus TaxID=1964332 RepID=UPI004068716A